MKITKTYKIKSLLILISMLFCIGVFGKTLLTFEEGSFVPQAKLQNGKSYSIITDHLGTPIQAYDEQGEKVWERELDIYGKIRNISGESSFIPFTYQGQYYDEETEFVYNRFRYYSPDTGTYISQDPIRLKGSNANFYAYTRDINIWVDLFGLTGTYIFTDGMTSYIGKEPEGRMGTSIKQRLGGNNATAKTHVNFGNNDMGLMADPDYNAVDNDAFANRINSPGKKKYEALQKKALSGDVDAIKKIAEVDAEASKIKADFEGKKLN